MFMLHVCMWRDLCSKIACCVEAAHNTHPRATRTSTTPPRRAPLAHSSLCTCTVLCWPELVLRARPPLAGGVPWSPTRDHGPCEARAKQLRLSLGDDAHQEEQRARAHVSLTAPFVANPALKICGQLLRVARVAALREGHLPWEHGRALFVAFMASTFLPASSQLPGKRILRCGTVEPPQPQARRRAPRRLSRPARPRATALLDGLAGRRSRPSIGRCVMLVGSAKLAGDFFILFL